ncbi:glutamine-hydrolyzing GMP synthase [Porphyromonas uenonis]|uniref:glutamine-hydrolyzing GMP synthase n=1 Tax=Porphyromonas uenonis TaxID=281920 RepID=UPI00046F46E9|nr:glutamine-hydrolyzing GMP synthase [Porphyromonas uenonis]
MPDKIIIADFGSQTTQLIGRRLRDLNTYCEIVPYNKIPTDLTGVRGIILSGSPYSVYAEEAFTADIAAIRGRLPILGICYGAQLMVHQCGGAVENSNTREYGASTLQLVDKGDPLLAGLSPQHTVWMSHGDTITRLPEGFKVIASTPSVQYAAYRIEGEETWGVQFHPEIHHSEEGTKLLDNFVTLCGIKGEWSSESFIESSIASIRAQVGDEQVIMALSGGVDSSVAAVLLHRAIGDQLTCIFVDHGLMRLGEAEQILADYKALGLGCIKVDASAKFLGDLAGVRDPEAKRKVIGRDFIEVFEAEAKKLPQARWLGQGTIYPDIIESINITGKVIKSHHNVGGLPERMHLKLVEPLKHLFKDEVRRVGLALAMPRHMIFRHPFPGPGLGIRVLGEVTPEKVAILQQADKIYTDMLRKYNLYDEVWQAGAILLPVQSVGVMGDERTYEYTVALRAVTSVDAMSADWARLPYDFLAEVSNEIINKVRGVNRVCYDVSSKPPATIEWE